MNECVVNSYFNTHAPSIEDYLPLDKDLVNYVRT